MNLTHTACYSANTPSYYEDNCWHLAKNLHNSLQEEMEAQIVDSQTKKVLSKCYSIQPGITGW